MKTDRKKYDNMQQTCHLPFFSSRTGQPKKGKRRLLLFVIVYVKAKNE